MLFKSAVFFQICLTLLKAFGYPSTKQGNVHSKKIFKMKGLGLLPLLLKFNPFGKNPNSLGLQSHKSIKGISYDSFFNLGILLSCERTQGM